MSKILNPKCKSCFHFQSFRNDVGNFYDLPASCQHPRCFKTARIQNVRGEVVEQQQRVDDILTFFRPDGSCGWVGFKLVVTKRYWGFQKTTEKVQVENK